MYDKLKAALRMGSDWLGELAHQYSEYFGGVGTSEFVEELLQCMSVAFDWQYFLQENGRYQKEHKEAFLKLLKALRPDLQRCSWPDPQTFPHVERHWYDKEPKKIGAQHFQLIRRLKEEYAKRPDWSKVVGWSVVPVVRPPATEPVAVLVRVPDLDFYTRRVAVLLCPRSFSSSAWVCFSFSWSTKAGSSIPGPDWEPWGDQEKQKVGNFWWCLRKAGSRSPRTSRNPGFSCFCCT